MAEKRPNIRSTEDASKGLKSAMRDHDSWPRMIRTGNDQFTECHEMIRSTVDFQNDLSVQVLRERLAEQKYLYLPQFIPERHVLQAFDCLASDLKANGFIDSKPDSGTCLLISDGATGSPGLLERQDLARQPKVRSVLEHKRLRKLMRALFSSCTRASSLEVRTHPYKWLRAVSPGLHTGPHVDATYFPGSQYPSLLTAWIPLMDVTTKLGSLVVAPSAVSEPLIMPSTGNGTTSGWVKIDDVPHGWLSADMKAGDCVIIHPSLLHLSSINSSSPAQWRISCDTRWWPDSTTEPANNCSNDSSIK